MTLFSLLLLSSAGSAGCADNRIDRQVVLSALTEKVFLPGYIDLETRAETLRDAAAALEAAPGEGTLDAVQQAWRGARKSYCLNRVHLFGPAETQRVVAAIDAIASVSLVDGAIAGTDPIDEASVEAASPVQKGFFALEYLLFDAAGNNAAVLASLSGADPAPTRRRALVVAAAAVLKNKLTALREAWDPARGNFAAELVNAGKGSTAFATQKEAIDTIANRLTLVLAKVADERLGAPLGVMTGGAVAPAAVIAGRSRNAVAEIVDHLRGVQTVYQGAPGSTATFAALVQRASADADTRMRAQLAEAEAAAAAIPEPMTEQLASDPTPAQTAYQRVDTAHMTLSTQVLGVLGVAYKGRVSDND